MDSLFIEGKEVTERNARRFVQARRPHAEASRQHERGWGSRSYVSVRDRTGGAPWCQATGKNAGEAWLKAARQMVEHDARAAADKHALEVATAALANADTPSSLEAAALRFAATRIEQSKESFHDERLRWVKVLREMADKVSGPLSERAG